jgi:hypothetical protein
VRWNQTDRHVGRRIGALAGEGDRGRASDAPGGASGRRQATAHSGARNVAGAVGEERIGARWFWLTLSRHCERSEAIQESSGALRSLDRRVASLLAMTIRSDRLWVQKRRKTVEPTGRYAV